VRITKYVEKVENPGTPTRDGYDFDGWYTDAIGGTLWDFAGNAVTEDITLYAQWTQKDYTVTFNVDGGTYNTQSVKHGEYAENPGTPTKDGYDFDGWYTEAIGGTLWDFAGNAVTEDITLYAQWTQKDYTVTFNVDGNIYDEQSVKHGEYATNPETPTKYGYDFDGWYTAADGGEAWELETDAVTENRTLYAQWTQKEYTVTFNVEGETFNTQSVKHGEYAEYPGTPTMYGYTFTSWRKGSIVGKEWKLEANAVTEDITLYAWFSPTPR
jgi:uncharacterized repeat protein (TIGR02543 family)